MTMIDEEEIKCSLCGKISKQPVLLSSNQFGYQDLDLRPSEMYRSTINTWVLECPHCGYVATNLEDELTIDTDFLESEEYKTCNGIEFQSKLSEIFYKYYLIQTKKSDDVDSFFAILQCVWTCDDANDEENAKLTRQIAINIADKIIESGNERDNKFIVLKADLLRRSGEFDQLIEEYENLTLGDELLDNIIKFQVKKAYDKDNNCYTIEEVS